MSDDSAKKPSRSSTVGLHKGAKSLIRNVLRHTDTHNRLLEESEMWQVYHRLQRASEIVAEDTAKMKTAKVERLKEEKSQNSEDQGKSFKDPDIHHSFLYDDRRDMRLEDGFRRGIKRAHMDDNEDQRRNAAASSKSTFWMRELQKTEETDPDRWGHAGFKELYPEVFHSDRSNTDDDNSKHKSKKKKHIKKRHKHKSVDKKKKRKRLDSDSVKKKKTKRKSYKDDRSKEKKRKKHKKSDNDSDSSDETKWIERKTLEVKNGSEVSESEDNSEEDLGRKRGRRNMKTESEREKRSAIEAGKDKHRWSKKRRKH